MNRKQIIPAFLLKTYEILEVKALFLSEQFFSRTINTKK